MEVVCYFIFMESKVVRQVSEDLRSRKISGCCVVIQQTVEGYGIGLFLLLIYVIMQEWKEYVLVWWEVNSEFYSILGFVNGGKKCELVG